jgi:hypothetical protein
MIIVRQLKCPFVSCATGRQKTAGFLNPAEGSGSDKRDYESNPIHLVSLMEKQGR